MRLQVTTPSGIKFGDRHYAQGEEFDMPDDMRHARAWAGALIHNKQARSMEPVVLGTAPPPPRERKAPVESTPTPAPESTPEPVTPPSSDVVAPVQPPEEAEPQGDALSSTRRGRYVRR